jgi:SAM-dependent methyltransferase
LIHAGDALKTAGKNPEKHGQPEGRLLRSVIMRTIERIGLSDVQAVYSGAEGELWELIMGEQIHMGGLKSSMELAEKAGIKKGSLGIDLCSCTGAGMRFLILFREVGKMTGVDATESVIERGRVRCAEQGVADKAEFVLADVCDSGLPSGEADFVWGEDAWCYVKDKARLISEAARLVTPGGTIAFTDWIEGPTALAQAEAERFMSFMKFPSLQDLPGYCQMLESNGCEVLLAEDTGRFAPCVEMYLNYLNHQLAYDAFRILRFDYELMCTVEAEMKAALELARAGKLAQGLFVARKKQEVL